MVRVHAPHAHARSHISAAPYRELENFPEGEHREMIELYTSRGMALQDASSIISVLARYPRLFVEFMVVEELGLQHPSERENHAATGALLRTGPVPSVFASCCCTRPRFAACAYAGSALAAGAACALPLLLAATVARAAPAPAVLPAAGIAAALVVGPVSAVQVGNIACCCHRPHDG